MLRTLFTGPIYDRTDRLNDEEQIVRWWEDRRWHFNKVVGCTGIVTSIAMTLSALISEPLVGEPIGLPDPPIFMVLGILAYGILANICFTGGWIVELALRQTWFGDTNEFAVRAFRLGTRFSVALTLFPAVLCYLALGIALLSSGRGHAPS